MKFSISAAAITALFASVASAQKFNTFQLMSLRTGTAIHHSIVSVNENNELVIDRSFEPFVGDWYDDGTVQSHNTSLWLTVGSDNKLIVGIDSHKWDVTGVPADKDTAFRGYLEGENTSGYYAVPIEKGYQLYTNYKPKDGDKSIPFALSPLWNNYTVPIPSEASSSPCPSSSTSHAGGNNVHTAFTTITEWASPVIKTITVGGVHSLSTVTTKAAETVTVTVTETVSNCK